MSNASSVLTMHHQILDAYIVLHLFQIIDHFDISTYGNFMVLVINVGDPSSDCISLDPDIWY
jgi:hypothetical protein